MKRSTTYLGGLLILLITLIAGSCGNKESELQGSWVGDGQYQGFKVTNIMTFEKGGTFTQDVLPTEDDGIGYEVTGNWEMSTMGKLKLTYHVKSIKSIPGKTYYQTHDDEDSYLSRLERKLRNLNEEDSSWSVKIGKGTLKLTNGSDEVSFDTIDEEDVENMVGKAMLATSGKKSAPDPTPSRVSSFNLGITLPTSGSIHQFDCLSEHRLTHKDIAGYNGKELRLLRNAIYALHNYDFISADLQDYFGNFSGYTPVSRNVRLNKTESANVAFIQSYE